MDTTRILADLRAERNRIDQAISALESLAATGTAANRGHAKPKGGTIFQVGANRPSRPGRRTMSAAAKKRISEAAKKRWARLRAISEAKPPAAQKPASAKKAAPARHMSAAARKRISEAAKKRWAARRKAKA